VSEEEKRQSFVNKLILWSGIIDGIILLSIAFGLEPVFESDNENLKYSLIIVGIILPFASYAVVRIRSKKTR